MKKVFVCSFLFFSFFANAQTFAWFENKDFYDSVYYTCFFGSGFKYEAIREDAFFIRATKEDKVKLKDLIIFYEEIIALAERPIENKDFYEVNRRYGHFKIIKPGAFILTDNYDNRIIFKFKIKELKKELEFYKSKL